MIPETIERSQELVPTAEQKRDCAFADFAAVPSNLGAIEAGMRFAHAVTPFVAVIGAPGWGKSHLLQSVASYMRLQGARVSRPIAALAYAESPERVEESPALLLDDVQDAWSSAKPKQELRRLLEHRVRGGRPTLVTFSDTVDRQEAARFLPSGPEWAFQTICRPSKSERDLVVRQIADTEGVRLSSPIVNLISRHLFGNGRSIQGAVQKLKMLRPRWSQRDDVCEACGVLMPYIHGENGWDPRDVVMDVVAHECFLRSASDVSPEQMCAYILTVEMGLSEYDVATFLGVSPTKAYSMSTGVKLRLDDPALANCVRLCRAAVVRCLDAESC